MTQARWMGYPNKVESSDAGRLWMYLRMDKF